MLQSALSIDDRRRGDDKLKRWVKIGEETKSSDFCVGDTSDKVNQHFFLFTERWSRHLAWCSLSLWVEEFSLALRDLDMLWLNTNKLEHILLKKRGDSFVLNEILDQPDRYRGVPVVHIRGIKLSTEIGPGSPYAKPGIHLQGKRRRGGTVDKV